MGAAYCDPDARSSSSRTGPTAPAMWHAPLVQRTSMKKELVASLMGTLEAELANMRRAAKDAREAATHEEAKPENDKDTRALEASYLAGGQAARVRELEVSLKVMEGMPLLDLTGKSVQASAVVVVVGDGDAETTFFMAPIGGGATVRAGTFAAQVLTPQSPLGQALLGKSVGDVVELRVKGKPREMTISEVW